MSREDELVNALVRMAKSHAMDRIEINPEAHYNNYGTRGVADLHVRNVEELRYGEKYIDRVYEVKSPAAVRSATGANEIIRQYNRMRENFYEHSKRKRPKTVDFELSFVLHPITVRHVAENLEMYSSADRTQLYDHRSHGTEMVLFRIPDPNNIIPAKLLGMDAGAPDSIKDWCRGLRYLATGYDRDNAYKRVLEILIEEYDLGLAPGY